MTKRRPRTVEEWEALLAAEGMPAELPRIADEYKAGRPEGIIHCKRAAMLARRVRERKEDADSYYSACSEYLWGTDWRPFPSTERIIWDRHCRGETSAMIAWAVGGVSAPRVRGIVQKHRRFMLKVTKHGR